MSKNIEPRWIANVNILERGYPIYGLYREEPYQEGDSGWRVISEADTPAFLDEPTNIVVLTEEEIFTLEPALETIKNLPAGTELELIQNETDVHFVDFNTKEPITV